MSLKTTSAVVFVALAAASAASAASFTVAGTEFNVTTVSGTFDDNFSLLESQVWWGNEGLALEFAAEIGTDLGLPNNGVASPFFAFDIFSSEFYEIAATLDDGGVNTITAQGQRLAQSTFAIATAASPLRVSVDGINYDVATITGQFDETLTLLQSQVWWGDEALALEFAEAVGTDLGLPNNGVASPFFAFDIFSSEFYEIAATLDDGGVNTITAQGQRLAESTFAFAIPVAAVPLPAGGLLLLTGLGGVAALKRLKRRAASLGTA